MAKRFKKHTHHMQQTEARKEAARRSWTDNPWQVLDGVSTPDMAAVPLGRFRTENEAKALAWDLSQLYPELTFWVSKYEAANPPFPLRHAAGERPSEDDPTIKNGW